MNEFGVPVAYVWVMSALAGIVFGVIAKANGRSIAGYATMAVVTALFVAGSAFGLAHAVTVPYTTAQGRHLGTYATVFTVVVIAGAAAIAWKTARRV